MECFHGNEELIYSDHHTGYTDIFWCPDCGALRITDEDEETKREPKIKTSQQQDSIGFCKCNPASVEHLEDIRCMKCGEIIDRSY